MKIRTGVSILIVAALAVLIVPIAAGAATSNTTISSVVSAVISISSGATVNVNVLPTGAGSQSINSDTVSVSTNDSNGYTLQLEDNDATTYLASGGNQIVASAGTHAAPAVPVVNTWGYHVDGGTFTGSGSVVSNQLVGSLTFAGVPASGSPDTLKTTSAVAVSDTTSVWYQVYANTSTVAGTYTDVVKYTATAN